MRFRASRRPVGDTRWPRSWPEVPFREHFCSDGPHGFPPPTLQCLHLAAPSYMGDMGAGKGWPWDLSSGKPRFRDLWDVGHSLPGPRSASCLWLPSGLKCDHCHPWWWPQNFRELFTAQAVCQVLHSRAWVTVSSNLHDRPLRPASCPMLQRSTEAPEVQATCSR